MGASGGFGLAKGRALVLTTFNFPAGTSTWTAPAGVTSLTSAVGKGSNGTADSWNTFGNIGTFVFGGNSGCGYPLLYGSTLDYSVPYAQADGILTTCQGFTTSASGETVTFVRNYTYSYCSTTSQWRYLENTEVRTVRRVGTCLLTGAMPSSGTANVSTANAQRTVTQIQLLTAGASGTATTGFSLTFPGGTPSVPTATDSTFNNVAVTPGTTYTIVNNGTMTIQYFV